MGVDIIRPRVCDLIFQLYGRPLHPELFDILAVRKIRRDDYELTVRITRTGHVYHVGKRRRLFDRGGRHGPAIARTRRLLRYRLRGEHADNVACADGIHYQMSFQVEVLAPEIFLHVHDEIRADGGKRGFLHNFRRIIASPSRRSVSSRSRPDGLLLPVHVSHLPGRAYGRQDSVVDREARITLHRPILSRRRFLSQSQKVTARCRPS